MPCSAATGARCIRRWIRSTRSTTPTKVEALRRVDALLRALDPRVQQVMVSLSGGVDTVLVARSDGVLAADVRPLVRINVQVIVEQNGRRESGYAGVGGRYSLRASCWPTASRRNSPARRCARRW